ncbi:DNA polymerase III subunit gamma and tau [Rothia kristinae]|uniref:DNA polymerase III subunit gamma and tau n=2 Tax=Rothia kristinae TaxID=37923 RepID=UPI0037CAD284
MSTALYRRYRPETFADVIGQEHVTEPLMTALRNNRVNHAYLFSGPRGCGKTTSARILARCLNCAEGPTPTPCGHCESCRDLARDGAGSLDVIEMDAASHGGVDHARDLRERATFAPVRDRYKIFIIDEAHMVTREGFNALLKIVEEPPEHIKFVFATTEPAKVLGTIRSRTHHYPFRLVPPETLRTYLAHLCEQEGIAVEQGVLPLVVRAGGGSVRDSLSVLDQLMGGSGSEGITYDLAVALLGFTHAELLDGVVDAFAAGDAPAVFQAVDRVISTGQDPRRFVEDLLERFRDLIIVRAAPDAAASILHGLSEDQVDRMRGQAQQLGAAELSRAADITNAALTEMTGATTPQLHLELLCARILLPTADDSTRGVGARVDRLERRINLGTVGAVAAPLRQDPAALTTPETPAEHAAAQAAGTEDGPERSDGSAAEGMAAAPDGREAALAMARRNRPVPPGQQTGDEDAGADAVDSRRVEAGRTGNDAAGNDAAEPSGAPSPAADQHPEAPERETSASHMAEDAGQYQPQPTAPADAGQVTMIQRSWADVVAAVGSRSKVGQATFRECQPSRFEDGVLYVSSRGPGIQSRVQRYAGALSEALQEVLGISCQVAVDGGPGPSDGGGRGPQGPSGPGGPGGSGGPGAPGGSGRGPGGPASSSPARGQSEQDGQRGHGGASFAGAPGRGPERSGHAASTARAEEPEWPDEDQWERAAQQALRERPAASSAGRAPDESGRPRVTPDLPQGPRAEEEAWRRHGEPAEGGAPAWSEDAEGEDFGSWEVAAIPGDGPEQAEATQDTASQRSAPEVAEGQRPARPAPVPSQGSPDPRTPPTGSLSVVPSPQEPGEAPADSGDPGQHPAPDATVDPTQEAAPDHAPTNHAAPTSDAHPADPGASSPGASSSGSETEEAGPAHDWSVAARRAGAPGEPVDGRRSGWGYAGPDDGSARHPSQWGERAPHLVEIPGGAGAPGGGASSRHLRAVPDDAASSAPSSSPADGQAPPDTGPAGPEGHAPSTPPTEPAGPARDQPHRSFRERHAAAIAAGARSHGGPGVDSQAPEPPEDWEDFAPTPEDEDLEDSAMYGQAAVETLLGGRVIEERPHQAR